MILTRLTRLLNLLTLTRRALYHTLRCAREYLRLGRRARGLRELRHYRRLKADLQRQQAEAVQRLTALMRVTA